MDPIHIRESIWRGETPKGVTTLCGKIEGGSISWDHMQKAYDGSVSSAITKHVKSLEICDDCYEDFKKQYDPESYLLENED